MKQPRFDDPSVLYLFAALAKKGTCDDSSETEGSIGAADDFAVKIEPMIRAIQASGVTGLHGIARAMATRKVETRRGGQWTPMQVADLLKRLDRAP